MNREINVQIITQSDLLNSGCFNIPEVISKVEQVLLEYDESKIYFPDKTGIIFDEENQRRINCMPAGFSKEGIYGVKWVSVFPDNPQIYGKPNLSAVIVLSELQTGFPIAIMEGSLISELRTAAISAVAAKYLARANSKTIGFIGAGEQAKSHFMAIKHVVPSIEKCMVASRTRESEMQFVSQLSTLYPEVEFIACNNDYKKSVIDADVIVTAISGQEQILKAEWIKEGAFYCHVGGLEDEFAVALKADKIVVDSWEGVKSRTQTLSQMYTAGILSDDDIYADLYEIIQGDKQGRVSDREFTYFDSVGLSYLDIAIAFMMYKKVKANGLGETITLCDKSIFDCDKKNITI